VRLTELPFQAMPPQPAFRPEDIEPFVSAPRIGILAYTKKNGTPAQVPIWYRYDKGRFLMLTGATSDKARALAREKRACLTIQDDMPPYRAVIVDGDVTLEAAPVEGGLNAWLAQHYFGKLGGREYEKMSAEESSKHGLVTVILDPTRVRGFDNHRIVGRGLRLFMKVREIVPLPRSWF
jgi:nitroimidazol reductase NimA-like FMN-containing flavoprotein (pyridoxamine 5'-phosphate oxidase superfamily)